MSDTLCIDYDNRPKVGETIWVMDLLLRRPTKGVCRKSNCGTRLELDDLGEFFIAPWPGQILLYNKELNEWPRHFYGRTEEELIVNVKKYVPAMKKYFETHMEDLRTCFPFCTEDSPKEEISPGSPKSYYNLYKEELRQINMFIAESGYFNE